MVLLLNIDIFLFAFFTQQPLCPPVAAANSPVRLHIASYRTISH